jgi:sigma-E factor negative regulatory protein RseA
MKTDSNLPLNELQRAQISDLADAQLRGDAFAQAMALLETSSSARAAWHGLHVAGDALRGESNANMANSTKDMAFLDVFRSNLAKEPSLVSFALPSTSTSTSAPEKVSQVANDSFFNWKWVGGISAAAAAVAFSWNLVGITATSPNGSEVQLAKTSVKETVQASSVATQTSAGVMLRNPQLDALIAAHNQVGGSSALQMPSGFLRSATFSSEVTTTVLGNK